MNSPFRKLSFAGFYMFAGGIPFSLLPPQIGIFLAFLGWLLEGVIRRNWQFKSHPILWVLAVYWGWNLIISALSERPIHSLLAVIDNEWLVLIFLMMYWIIKTKEELFRIVWTLAIFSIPALLYGIIQAFIGYEVIKGVELLRNEGQTLYKAVGFHGFPLTYAAFAMIVMFVAGSLAYTSKNKLHTTLSTLIALSAFAAVYVTNVRSIWLGTLIGVIVSVFFVPRRISFLIIIVGTIIFYNVYTHVPTFKSRVQSITDISQNPERIQLYTNSIPIIKDYWFIGYGQDNFDLIYPRYKGTETEFWETHPHNDYLNVLLASGIIGLAAFLAMWGITLRNGFSNRLNEDIDMLWLKRGATLSLVGLLIGALFQNYYGTFLNCMEWWFVVGVILTANALGQKLVST